MISKVASLHPQLKGLSRLLTTLPKACFAAAPEKAAAAENESAMFRFEKEWKKHYDERNSQQLDELDKILTENQKKRVELISEALLELQKSEIEYFTTVIRERVFKTSGINPLKLNLDWPTIKQMDLGSWPPVDPNGILQKEGIEKLWPAGQQNFAELFGGMGFGGAGAAPQQSAVAEKPKEEAKVEEKVEKLKFDIELSAIDPTKKIAIIKEVREITKLGLKEAKELVEKAPAILKKDVKKEEAEQLKEKLAAIGCTVSLL